MANYGDCHVVPISIGISRNDFYTADEERLSHNYEFLFVVPHPLAAGISKVLSKNNLGLTYPNKFSRYNHIICFWDSLWTSAAHNLNSDRQECLSYRLSGAATRHHAIEIARLDSQ